MFGQLLTSAMQEHKDQKSRTKYSKNFGWHVFDEDGDKIEVGVAVFDIEFGYSVFYKGETLQHLFWSTNLSEAVEWAVDFARKEIAAHEAKQYERALADKTKK